MSGAPVLRRKDSYYAHLFAFLTADMEPATSSRLSELLEKNLRQIRAGVDIFAEGDEAAPILCVVDGWVALNKSLEDGHVQTIDIIVPPDIVLPTAADEQHSIYDVHALTDATVSSISRVELDRIEISDPPKFWTSVRARSAPAHARVAERTLRLGQGSAEMRIAYVLIELCLRLSAHKGEQGSEFDLPLTQQQIGEFAGLSSVHVCRTLRRLSRKGLIDTSDNLRIVIHDIEGLAEIADAELDVLKSELLTPEV